MIIDHLGNIQRYAALGKNYATAAKFLVHTDLNSLPFGKTEIDGDRVFANYAENFLDRDEMAWEAHQRYTDIQLIVQGKERFGWVNCAEYGPLDGDFQACYPVETPVQFTLTDNQFVIFLPNEPHSPGNPVKAPARCRKLVIKVLHQD